MNANEDYFETEPHVGETQMFTKEDAFAYFDQVELKFKNQPQVYEHFMDLMEEVASRRIDIPGAIQIILNLFQGHPDLIIGLNRFLPSDHRIEVKPNEQVQDSIPVTNLGGGAASGPTSLTIRPGGPPTTMMSPHSSPGNAVNKVCGSEISQLQSDLQALTLETRNPSEV